MISRDVTFNESQFVRTPTFDNFCNDYLDLLEFTQSEQPTTLLLPQPIPTRHLEHSPHSTSYQTSPPSSPSCSPTSAPIAPTQPTTSSLQIDHREPPRCSSQTHCPSINLEDNYIYISTNSPDSFPTPALAFASPTNNKYVSNDSIPTFEEAIKDAEWTKAMHEEMKSIHQNNIWQFEYLLQGVTSITCQWVYRKKSETVNPQLIKKARLVARSFEQRSRLEYKDTFASVLKWDLFKLQLPWPLLTDGKSITWMWELLFSTELLKNKSTCINPRRLQSHE